MSIQPHFFRVSSLAILVLLSMEPVTAQDTKQSSSSKPISNNNRSSQSSRLGARLQQSPTQNRISSTSSRSSSYSRNPSSSQSSSSSNRDSNYSRNSGSGSNRGSNYSRNTGSTSNRDSNYSRSSGSSSINRNRSTSGSATVDRVRGNTGSSSMDRNRGNGGTTSTDRNRGNSGSTSIDRNHGISGSSSIDRIRDHGLTAGDRDRGNRDSWQNSGGSNRDQRNPSTWNDLNRYNRDRYSNDYSRGQHTKDRDEDNSRRDYTHYNNGNHDRTSRIGGNSHNRYRINLNRNKYSNHYYDRNDYDRDYYDRNYYDRLYSPYHNSLYSSSYYNRRYYSPSTFSTIILGAAIGYGGYSTYASGKSYASGTGGYVELFEHSGFRGDSLEIYAGESVYNLKEIHIDHYKTFNDRFSSIKVFGEVTVVLYKDADLRGEYVYLTSSHIDFGRDRLLRRFNDEISAIEVLPGIVEASTHNTSAREYQPNDQVPDHAAYQQQAAAVPTNTPVSSSTAAPLDSRPSVNEHNTLGTTPRVFLFDQPDFRGNQIVLSPGSVEVNLSRITKGLSGNWNDSIASIRVEGGAELFLYTDPEFLGDGIAIRESVSNLSLEADLSSFVNSISSVVVNGAH